MKCDSQASLLARTFASLCFGRKPKVKVVTNCVSITLNVKFALSEFYKIKRNGCIQTKNVN
jgi:hypothetical protein